MTPKEVAAWRKAELRERAKEKAARQEHERQQRAKRGRPKGKKRLQREAERDTRRAEVSAQQAERRRRSRAKGKPKSTYRKSYQRELGLVERRRTRRAGVEKTLLRFKGVSSGLAAVDALLAMPKGTSAYVQLGAGYQQGATWVGSRLTSPQDAAVWLQGVGLKYAEKIFGNKADVEELFIEVIGYRRYNEGEDDDDDETEEWEGSNDSFSLGPRRAAEGGEPQRAGGGAGRGKAGAGKGARRKAAGGVGGRKGGARKAGGRTGGPARRRKGRR